MIISSIMCMLNAKFSSQKEHLIWVFTDFLLIHIIRILVQLNSDKYL